MRITFLLSLIALVGCEQTSPPERAEWRCIDGLTYERTNGAWVLLDGHPYIGRKDGPIRCAEPTQGKPTDGGK